MAEWSKARAWKARVANPYRGFESHPLRHFDKAFHESHLRCFYRLENSEVKTPVSTERGYRRADSIPTTALSIHLFPPQPILRHPGSTRNSSPEPIDLQSAHDHLKWLHFARLLRVICTTSSHSCGVPGFRPPSPSRRTHLLCLAEFVRPSFPPLGFGSDGESLVLRTNADQRRTVPVCRWIPS